MLYRVVGNPNSMTMKCIIVEDEPLARKGMAEYVKDVSYLSLMGSFEGPHQALEYLAHHPVDLMLLDIRMPRQSGIDFLKSLQTPPLVIFTTAFPEYALESYELSVIDYLVKPISFDRFTKATQKAYEFFSLRKSSPSEQGYFFIRCDYKLERVNFSDVQWVESMQNYCILHVGGRKMISHITLTQLAEKLPTDRFMRVHKSFIVSLEKVTGVEGANLLLGQQRIPMSRTLKNEITQRVLGNNFLKR